MRAEELESGGGAAIDGGGARGRILETAYRLFSSEGIHAVGVDRIVAEARVAKMTLYRHFASKEELVLAWLDLREQRWTRGWLQREVEMRAHDGRERLLTIFLVLDEWFRAPDFEGCAFVRTLTETQHEAGAVREATIGHLATVRGLIRDYAAQAQVVDPDHTARQVHMMMLGSMVAAAEGVHDAARPAQDAVRATLG